MKLEKLLDYVSQPSTWTGAGLIGALAVMGGVQVAAIQQASVVVIGLIGVWHIIKDENK